MFRIARRRLTASVALCLALAASATHADVLKVAPKDSLGVLKVNHLAATNKKAVDFFNKLGVSAMVPALADPWAAFKKKIGATAGLNEDGDAGLILLPAANWPDMSGEGAGAGDKQPAIVLLLPVSDYKAFIAGLTGATTEGDLTTVPNDGKPGYIMKWGDYAAFSPKKEHVQLKGDGVSPASAATKELDGKDIVLWANVPALKAALLPQLAAHKGEWLEKMDAEIKGNADGAKFAGVARAAVTQLLAAAETFLNESSGATLSANLSDAGANFAVAAEFAPASYLGTWVDSLHSTKATTPSFTAGLPAGPYIFFGGAAISGDAMYKLMADFGAPIVKEFSAVDGVGADKSQKILDSWGRMFKSVDHMNFAMLAPRGAIGAESLFQLAYAYQGDPRAFADGMKDYSTAAGELMGSLMGVDAKGFTLEYKPAAKTVDGVPFDILSMGMGDPKTPKEAQMAQGMAMAYGPAGLQYQFGQLDARNGIMGLCLPDAALSKLIASAKAGSDDLGKMPNVMQTMKALPDKPLAEFYFAIDEAIRTGVSYARQFGMPANITLPENLPPVGFALTADNHTLRGEYHIPTELVQQLVQAYFQMMMGGGGNGGL